MESPEMITQTGAEDIHWNLDDLFTDPADLKIALETADKAAAEFATAYRGKVASLSAGGLNTAISALENIVDPLGRAYTFAYLNWTTATIDPETGALLQYVRESYTQTHQKVMFFDLEWAKIEEDQYNNLINDETLAGHKHHLETTWLESKHMLSEPEEQIMSEKSITGVSAWNRYFDETLGAAEFDFEGETLSEQEVLAKLHNPDRSVREAGAKSLTAGLKDHLRTLTFIFNTVLSDKATNDRLRGYKSWLTSRNKSNEASDEMVHSLIDAVTSRYDLPARFYKLKTKLLGLDKMMDFDRYAPIPGADRQISWNVAKDLVLDAYTDFLPEMGEIAGKFFDQNWIDAAVIPGKRGGAFSHGAVPSVHPYVMMNYTGRIRDVQTLAHELGHGIHQYLSRRQGVFMSGTPLTTAETASVFGEMLVFQKMIAQETNPNVQLSMLIGKIDDTMATVFRQIAMNRFENKIHTARREEGELNSDRFAEFWRETQEEMFQGSVTLGDHYDVWWSYIPHFLHTPGYVYAYAFGELLVLSLYAKYQEEGEAFPEKYADLLRAGGSDWPHKLVSKLGVDLEDPNFWAQGLAQIEALIDRAEKLADSLY